MTADLVGSACDGGGCRAQVSVRKAALGVSSGLLRALPGEAPLADLWVASALPLVRDVETSLQDQLLDSFHDFIVAPSGAQPCPAVRPKKQGIQLRTLPVHNLPMRQRGC